MSKPLNILAFTNMTASHKWRLSSIAERINRETEHAMYVTPFNTWNEDTLGADIVIFEMLASPEAVDICHKQGAKVIYEADDAVVDSYGHERKNLQHLGDKHRGDVIETLKRCDALTVTNQKLADNFARFTKSPIHILPNYIDLEWYGKDKLGIRRNSDEVRIGWFGSRGHFEDLRPLVPVLERVLASNKNARLIYCGYGGASSDKASTELMRGEDVFKGIPQDRREFILPVNEDMWPIKHRLLDLDIGIAPLIDDEFNWCKTPIKWMEYGILGTPSVCSNVLYGDVVKHGEDGLIAHTEDEWEASLTALIKSKELRDRLGENARNRVIEDFNIDTHWKEWVAIYEQIAA